MCCRCPAGETATFPFGSLRGTSENAGPDSTIEISLWLRGSKCASRTASTGVVRQQSDRLTDEVKAERLHSAPHNFFFSPRPLRGAIITGESFFYDTPIPRSESSFSLMATAPLCSGEPAPLSSSMRIPAETQPLQLQGRNAEIYPAISSVLGGYLPMRLKTTSLTLQFR